MAEVRTSSARRVREALARVREEVGPDVELLVATKYVTADGMEALRGAGVELVGENRLQDLVAKQERFGDAFMWDFIGVVQSRKVPEIVPRARLVHSIATDSALRRLERFAASDVEVLIQVNVAGEETKAGFPPEQLDAAIERCPVRVSGLMTMPPEVGDPEKSRPYFARLAELAAARGLSRLSMGTSQDYRVAVEEGATIVRLGSAIFD